MALTNGARGWHWHFWTRLPGLTGVLLLAIGLVVLVELDRAGELWTEGEALTRQGQWGIGLAVGGAALVLLALLFEIPQAVRLVATRRAALGSNVFLQIALAVALLA